MGVMHVRRLTTQEWADQNPILSEDQMAVDITTGDFRIGDGKTRWSKLVNYSRSKPSSTISFADITVTEDFLNGIEDRLNALETAETDTSYADTTVTEEFVTDLQSRLNSLESVDAITVVPHGADPNYPRPEGVLVAYWLGTVEPLNAIDDDLLSLEVDTP